MPKIAIMRHTKLKRGGNVRGALMHNYRERETPNAVEERTPDNVHLISSSTNEVIERMNQLLPDKVRKNAVVAIEYLMTASPEYFKDASEEQQKEYFERSLEYVAEKYGKENIVGATIHKDESTPHMAVYVVPITKDGRLCANDYLNGRKLLSQEQTNYHKKVEHLGVDRGVEGSKARHTTIKQYYQEINQKNQEIETPKIAPTEIQLQVTKTGFMKSETETIEQVANRINQRIKPVFEDIAQKANSRRFEREQAKNQRETLHNTEKRLSEAEKRLSEAEKRLKNWRNTFQKDLKPEQFENLKNIAKEKRQENQVNELKAYAEMSKLQRIQYKNSLVGDSKKEFKQRLEKVEKAVNAKNPSHDFDR